MARWGDWGGLEGTEAGWRVLRLDGVTELTLVIVFRIGCVVRLRHATYAWSLFFQFSQYSVFFYFTVTVSMKPVLQYTSVAVTILPQYSPIPLKNTNINPPIHL